MSKKFEYMKKAAFYAEQNPSMLAEVLTGLVEDVATSVSITGATSIKIPTGDDVTETYIANVLSQYGDVMSSATMSIPTTTGVSISDGTLTVGKTASEGTVVITATGSSKTGTLTVTLTK